MLNCLFYVKNGFSLFRLLELVYGTEKDYGWEGGIMYWIDVLIAEFLCSTCYIKACGNY